MNHAKIEAGFMNLWIDGEPVPCARPRFNSKTGRTYSSQENIDAKARLQLLFKRAWNGKPIERGLPVGVIIEFHYKSRRKKDLGRFKSTRPDVDNLLKLVLDAANGIMFWDDGQVVQVTTLKVFGNEAGTLIRLWPIEETPCVKSISIP